MLEGLPRLLEVATSVALSRDAETRRRLLWEPLVALLDADLLAIWFGQTGRRARGPSTIPREWPLLGARRAVVLGSSEGDWPDGPPLVARTREGLRSSVIAVWTRGAPTPAGDALLQALAPWIAASLAIDRRPSMSRPPVLPTVHDVTLHDVSPLRARPPLLVHLARLVGGKSAPVLPDRVPLTVREKQIAREVAAGRTNAEVARVLGIAEHTVKQHLKRAFKKLGVTRRAGLAATTSSMTGE